MHKAIRFFLPILFLMLLTLLVNGCSKSEAEADKDVLVPFAAYQYSKAEVQTRLPHPNSAVFPPITAKDEVLIEELEGNHIKINSSVAHRTPETSELKSSNFTVVLEYLGDGLFKTISIEVK
jgi:hypothetical protein